MSPDNVERLPHLRCARCRHRRLLLSFESHLSTPLQELQAHTDAKASRHAFALATNEWHGKVDLHSNRVKAECQSDEGCGMMSRTHRYNKPRPTETLGERYILATLSAKDASVVSWYIPHFQLSPDPKRHMEIKHPTHLDCTRRPCRYSRIHVLSKATRLYPRSGRRRSAPCPTPSPLRGSLARRAVPSHRLSNLEQSLDRRGRVGRAALRGLSGRRGGRGRMSVRRRRMSGVSALFQEFEKSTGAIARRRTISDPG